MTLKSELFDKRRHIRSGFCCGNHSLDNYIRKQASQDLERKISTVFILVDEPDFHILAYYTLSSYTVNITDLDEDMANRLPRYPRLPATLLGRLAVDNRHKGKGYGELMLVDALIKALNASVQVASLAVIAEALDEKGVNFYIKYGFRQFKHEPMKLYLPMKSIVF
jgi:predicted GNAT family N-acyltransferase